MKDLLLKYKQFTITTPYKANRRILFTEDFQDQEFDAFEVVEKDGKKQLLMSKAGQVLIRFEYVRATDSLEGRDVRGGVSVIRPLSNAIKPFREWHSSDRPRVSMYSEAPKVQIVENPGLNMSELQTH